MAKNKTTVISLFILAKVAEKWSQITLLFRQSKGEDKSKICEFSRYFSRRGKNFSRKCDCTGCNVGP